MTQWFAIFISVIAVITLLLFYRKSVTWWELLLLIIPSSLLILLLQVAMIASLTNDTEYWGAYITKVVYYEDWNEEVPCRHTYSCDCVTTKKGTKCKTCHEHAYDVDYHPEHWTEMDNYGNEYEISKSQFIQLQNRFNTKPYFVELNRNYYSKDGNAYYTNWNKLVETSINLTFERTYKNKIKASHSIFKFEDISEKTKKAWGLYDYPNVTGYYQPCVIGKKIDASTDTKFQFINSHYGVTNQFRMFVLFFENQSVEAAFKQRSYWEGGNKNEFVVCIGTDKGGHFQWCKAFSWMDKPELEVRVQDWFTENKTTDLNKFADYIPTQIESHWKRKHFKEFEYLQIELTNTQLIWILILVAIYNIAISIWVVRNNFYD